MPVNQVCSLCCTKCCDYQSLQNDLDKSNEIYNITVKYFDPMLFIPDESTNSHHNPVLCRDCWFNINEFNEYQYRVMKTRTLWEDKSNLTTLLIEVKQEDANQANVRTTNAPDKHSLDISEDILFEHNLRDEDLKTDSLTSCEKILESTLKQEVIQANRPILNTPDKDSLDKIENNEDNILFEHNLEYTESLTSCENSLELKQTDERDEANCLSLEVKGSSNFKIERARRSNAVIAEWKSEFICDLCSETVTNFDNMRNHFKEKHKSESYIKCCGRKFYRRTLLANHALLHLNPETHKCDLCGRSCTSIYGLKLHKKAMHEFREKFNCNICKKLFKWKVNLERHLLSHSTSGRIERPKLPCDVCGIELLSANGLKHHMSAYHNADSTIYVCSVCGKVAKSEIALRRHKNEVHATERKHKCTYCGKAFSRPNTLREHIAGHTGEDLYKCPNCPQTFKIKSNVSVHRKRIHPVEWEESRKHRPQYPNINNQVKKHIAIL